VIKVTDLLVNKTDTLGGTIWASPSKSSTHRALIATSLAEGNSEIEKPLMSDDTLATINACRLIGAKIYKRTDEELLIRGVSSPATPHNIVDCRNSASTIRFFTPICALAEGISVLTGGESLRNRPMEFLLKALEQLGVKCYSTLMNGFPPIVVFGGGIEGGRAEIRGDVSSQFISGLLIAAPKANNDTEICLLTDLESKPYVDMTLDILKKHSIKVEVDSKYKRFYIPSGQEYNSFNHYIEGDYSSAAFPLVAAAITNSNLRVKNLMKNSIQGDRLILNILADSGVRVKTEKTDVEINGFVGSLKPIIVDLKDNPDLVPISVVLACIAEDQSIIHGIRRLRFKESDRIASMIAELTKMGADIKIVGDSLKIFGNSRLHGAEMDSHQDHRIAMACTIAALNADSSSIIRGIECISKSYPNFIKDMRSIGADLVEK
jgi:3-phosphoshikimate 1-carboxyvinyltransferase